MSAKHAEIRIVGTGIAVPDRALTNDEICRTLNQQIDAKWVENTLGIAERRIADTDQKTSDLAASAAAAALKAAGVHRDSIDLLILATATPDRQAPATACITQKKLGLTNAVAFDISAVCSGFLFGLAVAASFLRTKQSHRALVIGADIFSRITDWSRKDCVFFGDGAGALVLERSGHPSAFFDAQLYTDGTRADVFSIPIGNSPFTMDGHGVFDAASYAVPFCVDRLLRRNGLAADDVSIVVPHQPSITLLRTIASRAKIPFAKFRTNMDRYANTAGATIPIMLHETISRNDISFGDLVLFAAAGAGFTAGAALYRWH